MNNELLELGEYLEVEIPKDGKFKLVIPKYMTWLLGDKEEGVIRFVQDDEHKQQRDAIQGVINLFMEWIDTGVKPDANRWDKARDASVDAVTDSRNASMAVSWFARDDAAAASTAASWAAYWGAYWGASRAASREGAREGSKVKQKAKLEQLLKEASNE